MYPRGTVHNRTQSAIYHDIKYELDNLPAVACALSDANTTWSSYYYKRFTTSMRPFRRRNEDAEFYTYQELRNHDQEIGVGSKSPTMTGSPLDLTPQDAVQFNSSLSERRPTVPLPQVYHQSSFATHTPLYTDHGTQTSSTPSPCYSTIKTSSQSSDFAVPEHRWYNGDDVELQAIAYDDGHRYPPGVVVIKTIDDEGKEIIDEFSFNKDKRDKMPLRREWDRLDGTGVKEGAVVKIAGKFVNTLTRVMYEWKGHGSRY
ncbi:hypothetical protein IAQ61_003496 [Plenodomus lingam]|uniref:Predicted protein n=1 Tax=Leptosphaeria maculans (strain JN3 / isolate v23.1.3 / race Av1-4-5-6-7-8) TaxID=985895 RepID=E4ZQ33_LEPMJ|nr:predicted protein [Plenodomus lingam JN3]KAH9874307.1 hypothetical protein IAQ61_003496 [Plenodomus lingam]CBX89943.1 predicted protein [Plenodomus lingam JN3]